MRARAGCRHTATSISTVNHFSEARSAGRPVMSQHERQKEKRKEGKAGGRGEKEADEGEGRGVLQSHTQVYLSRPQTEAALYGRKSFLRID